MSWEALLPYAAWLGNTSFAMWLGASTWRIALLLTVHLFGLTTLLGSVVVSSLHLLGRFQRQKPAVTRLASRGRAAQLRFSNHGASMTRYVTRARLLGGLVAVYALGVFVQASQPPQAPAPVPTLVKMTDDLYVIQNVNNTIAKIGQNGPTLSRRPSS
jgi:hypothetical protein